MHVKSSITNNSSLFQWLLVETLQPNLPLFLPKGLWCIIEELSGLFSVGSNIFVFFAIVTIPKLRTPANILIASICLANTTATLMTVPLGASSHFYEKWIWGESGCVWSVKMAYFTHEVNIEQSS